MSCTTTIAVAVAVATAAITTIAITAAAITSKIKDQVQTSFRHIRSSNTTTTLAACDCRINDLAICTNHGYTSKNLPATGASHV